MHTQYRTVLEDHAMLSNAFQWQCRPTNLLMCKRDHTLRTLQYRTVIEAPITHINDPIPSRFIASIALTAIRSLFDQQENAFAEWI